MIRWPWRRAVPDHEAFLTELAASHPGKRYDRMDRYADFRHVFLGDERGRRVLYEVLRLCGMYKSAAPRANFDTNQTMFFNGQQDIAFTLLGTINIEPKARPTSTKESK